MHFWHERSLLRTCPVSREMFRKKHKPGELWLDWHKRSFRFVGDLIREHRANILDKLHDLKQNWAGHCVRFWNGAARATFGHSNSVLEAAD